LVTQEKTGKNSILHPGKIRSLAENPVFSGFSGLRHLLGRLDRSRGIGMGRQLIAMGMGMGIMTGR